MVSWDLPILARQEDIHVLQFNVTLQPDGGSPITTVITPPSSPQGFTFSSAHVGLSSGLNHTVSIVAVYSSPDFLSDATTFIFNTPSAGNYQNYKVECLVTPPPIISPPPSLPFPPSPSLPPIGAPVHPWPLVEVPGRAAPRSDVLATITWILPAEEADLFTGIVVIVTSSPVGTTRRRRQAEQVIELCPTSTEANITTEPFSNTTVEVEAQFQPVPDGDVVMVPLINPVIFISLQGCE